MADRTLLLSHLPTEGSRGFEVGALMSPFLPKADHDVVIVDRLSTEELRAKFATEANVATDRIVDVDVVVRNGDLVRSLESRKGEGFDYAIASHVIEHIPDVIGWLSDIAKLLRVGGRLLLVVPDRRYTFDYLRLVSTLANLVDAWVRNCRTPTPGQVFDYNAHAAAVDKVAAWSGKLEPSALARYGTPRSALELSLSSYRDNVYLDSHCWVFTPASFLGICAYLAGLSLLQWKLVFMTDTQRDEEDFGLVLERIAPDAGPDMVAAEFRAAIAGTANMEPEQHADIVRLQGELDGMRSSSSWRVTAPLRRMKQSLMGAIRAARNRRD